MNLLGHLAAAVPLPSLQAGSVLGDSLKNRDLPGLPEEIVNGVRFHRACDVFTDSHPAVTAARLTLGPGLRRVSGILIDVYFDHLLARNWDLFFPQPLEYELNAFYLRLDAVGPILPPRAAELAGWLTEKRLLQTFTSLGMVEATLRSVNRRLAGGTFHLEQALPRLLENDHDISENFSKFVPTLLEFSIRWRAGPR